MASKPLDLTYITAESVAAFVVHPRRVMTAPEFEFLPIEVLSAAAIKEAGIDPLEVEQVIAVVSAPKQPGEPEFGLIIRFAAPYQKAGLLPGLLPRTEEAEYDGRAYRRALQPGLPSIFFADPQTLLIAPEAALKKMMSAKAADSPLLTLLKSADSSADLVAMFSVEMVRKQIEEQLAALPPLPPPVAEFTTIPQHLLSVEIQISARMPNKNQITLRARNEDSAKELERLINQGLDLGRQLAMSNLAATQGPADDAVQAAMFKYSQRMVNRVAEMFRPTRAGDRLVLATGSTVGIATTPVLVALLLPAVQSAREAARRTQAMNQMKNIILAFHNYEGINKRLPKRAIVDKDGKPLLSWRVELLPTLDAGALYDQFHLDEPWDSDHNKKLIDQMPAVYKSPTRTDTKTNFLLPAGKGTLFEGEDDLDLAGIKDGTSNTVLVVEADDDRAVIWTKPDDLEYDSENPLAGLGNLRARGFNVGMADGAVRFVPIDISPEVLRAMFTPAGGETLDGK